MSPRTVGVRLVLPWLLGFLLVSCTATPYVRQDGAEPVRIPDGEVEARIFLVGDAGDVTGFSRVAESLRSLLDADSTVVFLGDNDYARDELDEAGSNSAETLLAQTAFAATHDVLFIAGNHDWEVHGFLPGTASLEVEAVRAQSRFVRERNARFLPAAGELGPESWTVGPVQLIAIDSQAWLLEETIPAAVTDALRRELADGPPIKILLAHHPLETHGPHGGVFPWTTHLLPPLFGSIYVLARNLGVSDQDTSSGHNREYVRSLREAMADDPPLAVASGHEHALQVLEGEVAPFLLVSGSGSKVSRVGHGPRTLFSHGGLGFMELVALTDGRVALRVYAPEPGERAPSPIYSRWLIGPPDAPRLDGAVRGK